MLSKTVLEPALRGDVTHLRFSPDGKYVIAQDDSGINVLTREPFKTLFRIAAPEATNAQFTPDSQQIIFYNSDLRVERWSIAEQVGIKGNKQAAFDMYDQVFVAERLTGEIGLYGSEKNDLQAVVTLPRNELGRAAANAKTNLLCVENERGQLTVYDLTTLQPRDQFNFANPIVLTKFSEDGQKLFVLTANQTAYVLDMKEAGNR